MDDVALPAVTLSFPATLDAAQARIAAIDVAAYGRTRNHLEGAVTGLSPYLTHGFLDPPDVLAGLSPRPGADTKLVQELGWRAFFHHVWQQVGAGIFEDQRPPVWPGTYARALPPDLREGATGVPVIDQAVRRLYATGYLHNHARLWLASYTVHLRKVHWRAGADWLYAHLLDGDLASNHLSWQWVAGTFSHKPYLFNAENVARYAPSVWHSPGTVVDTAYEQLDALARSAPDVGPEPGTHPGIPEPPILAGPPVASTDPLPTLPERVRLVHPWDLGERGDGEFRLGVLHRPFHARRRWSAPRWSWVLQRLEAVTDALFEGDLDALAPRVAGCRLTARTTLNAGYAEALARLGAALEPVPTLFSEPRRPCTSFSQFIRQVVLLEDGGAVRRFGHR